MKQKKLSQQQNLAASLNKSIKEREERKKLAEQSKIKQNDVEPLPKLVNLWLQRVFFNFVVYIIRKMISILPIPTILEKIISDFKDDKFINYRSLIMRLHNRYKNDKGVSDTANYILKGDNFELGKSFKKTKAKSMFPESDKCSHPKCQKDLREEEKKIRIFGPCFHSFHFTSCLNGNENITNCILCNQKASSSSTSTTSSNSANSSTNLNKDKKKIKKNNKKKMILIMNIMVFLIFLLMIKYLLLNILMIF